MPIARWVAIVLATAPLFSSAVRMSRGIGFLHRAGTLDMRSHGRPGTGNCTTHWYKQTIDHFSWAPTPTSEQTFQQRYFVHNAFWKKGGPIFFYCGNEANVELYVNSTGLMWENARNFGAALVFAEHRYYGETQPFGKDSGRHMHYLTMEQALADYAQLIVFLKEDWKSDESAVVGFGGSYGGMLSAWLRMKYPSALDGAISASAPILAFHGQTLSFGDGEAFWQVVTRDASPEAGSAAACAPNVHAAWQRIFDVGKTTDGRRLLANIFRLCGSDPLKSENDVMRLASMQVNAWDTMAMGNFPYPSNYLIFSQTQDATTLLPAFPVRAACEHMNHDLSTDLELFAALRDAGGVFYNASNKQACFDLPDDPNYDGIWDYQWCTEMLPQETYFARDGSHDMFWPSAENLTAIRQHCKSAWGVEPRTDWISTEFGGTAGASNIVFSNGLYDPWSSGGVLKDVSDSAVAVIIPEGAHHLDLMFSHPLDPESVKTARKVQLAHIQKWIDQKKRVFAPLVV